MHDSTLDQLLPLALSDDPATVFMLVASGLKTLPSNLAVVVPGAQGGLGAQGGGEQEGQEAEKGQEARGAHIRRGRLCALRFRRHAYTHLPFRQRHQSLAAYDGFNLLYALLVVR